MTKDDAKLILQCCRDPGQALDDPLVAEALALAQHDPDLRAWWEAERALDAALSRRLKQTTVPSDLATRIITARRRHRPLRRSATVYLALAAMFILLGLLFAIFIPRKTPAGGEPLAAFRQDMSEFLRVFPKLDLETDKLSEVRAWLAQKPWLANPAIPNGLQKFPSIGCREVVWRDQRAALVCFMVDGEVIHLFLLPASSFPNANIRPQDAAQPAGIFSTSVWRSGDTLCLAMTKGDAKFLQKHIRS